MKGNSFEELRRIATTKACAATEDLCVADNCMAWREKEVVTWDSEINQRKTYCLAWRRLAGECKDERDLIGQEAGNGE